MDPLFGLLSDALLIFLKNPECVYWDDSPPTLIRGVLELHLLGALLSLLSVRRMVEQPADKPPPVPTKDGSGFTASWAFHLRPGTWGSAPGASSCVSSALLGRAAGEP